MKVMEFVGSCAKRNQEVIIKDNFAHPIAKGNAIDILNNKFTFLTKHMTCEELFKSDVYCFLFLNEKLYITLR